MDVGQGGGSTTASINIYTETGSSQGYSVERDGGIETTVQGFVFGFSIGDESEDTVTISHGEESEYSGTVSNINSNDVSDTYSFGLFTYIHTPSSHPNKQFEVINYWVE